MKAVIQRVKEARVKVNGKITGEIAQGLLVLLGIGQSDEKPVIDWACEKIVSLRIFSDAKGKFQHDLAHVNGEILVVSQFTLFGDCSKGRRPDFLQSADPKKAFELYEYFLHKTALLGFTPKSGVFGAHMEVESINDGPVTLILER